MGHKKRCLKGMPKMPNVPIMPEIFKACKKMSAGALLALYLYLSIISELALN
jgi:hypothetical protein